MLEYFITSKTKRKMLKLFILHPEGSFYVRQVEKLIQEPVTAARRELAYLEKAGFLNSWKEGNLKYYQVNRDFSFYAELKKIIYSTIGLRDYLENSLHDFSSIDLAFIYGSVAKNEEGKQSDIDLLLVGSVEQGDLHDAVSIFEEEIGREINYTLMTRQEFNQRVQGNDPFLTRVLKEEKILLKGSVSDYR